MMTTANTTYTSGDLQIACPNCGESAVVPPTAIGRRARCRRCQTVFTVAPLHGRAAAVGSPPIPASHATPQTIPAADAGTPLKTLGVLTILAGLAGAVLGVMAVVKGGADAAEWRVLRTRLPSYPFVEGTMLMLNAVLPLVLAVGGFLVFRGSRRARATVLGCVLCLLVAHALHRTYLLHVLRPNAHLAVDEYLEAQLRATRAGSATVAMSWDRFYPKPLPPLGTLLLAGYAAAIALTLHTPVARGFDPHGPAMPRAGLSLGGLALAVTLAALGYHVWDEHLRERDVPTMSAAPSTAQVSPQVSPQAPATPESDPAPAELDRGVETSVPKPDDARPAKTEAVAPTLPPPPPPQVTPALVPAPAPAAATKFDMTVTGLMRRTYERQQAMRDSVSFNQWNLAVTLKNSMPVAAPIGGSMVVYESNASGSTSDGVAVFRTDADMKPTDDALYGVSSLEQSGGRDPFLARFAGVWSFSTGRGVGRDVRYHAIESLSPGAIHTFTLKLRMGKWLEDDALANVRLVLPEVHLGGTQRYRLIAHFGKGAAGTWNVERQEVVRLDADELTKVLRTVRDPVMLNLAANWLYEVAPDRAAGPLADVAKDRREGALLFTCLHRLTELKSPQLAIPARALLVDRAAPPAIRNQSARYLGAIKDALGHSAVIAAANGDDEQLTLAAVEALGDYATPEANQALLALLNKNNPRTAGAVAEALVKVNDRGTMKTLEQKARAGDKTVLEALAYYSGPDQFEFFQGLARTTPMAGTERYVATGLARTGKERAVPLLLDLVRKSGKELRAAAASQLSSLPVGNRGPEVLELALAAAEDDVAGGLVGTLVKAKWTDPKATRRVGQRLARMKDATFAQHTFIEYLRLLPAAASSPQGPANFDEFVDDKPGWTAKWTDWASKQP